LFAAANSCPPFRPPFFTGYTQVKKGIKGQVIHKNMD
jgi:hypothetical protein